MQIRIALLVTLLAAAAGCATEAGQRQAGAAAPAEPVQPQSSRAYRTGSRLPSMDDDAGASTVSGVSKDDYMDDRNRVGASGVRGN